GERDAGSAARLRAVVDETVLVHVEVALSRPAAPLVRQPEREPTLELPVRDHGPEAGEADERVVDLHLPRRERLQLAVRVVDDAERGREAELLGPPRDHDRSFGSAD